MGKSGTWNGLVGTWDGFIGYLGWVYLVLSIFLVPEKVVVCDGRGKK